MAQTVLTELSVEAIIGAQCSGEIPRMHKHVLSETSDERSGIELRRWVVPDGGYSDGRVEESRARQHGPKGAVGDEPPLKRVVARPIWLRVQRPQQQHVVETDHVLEHA